MTEFFMGIDGGGSKTLGVLIDADGGLRAASRAAGAAVVGQPGERSCEVLVALKTRLCADAGVPFSAVARIGLGLNGIDFADEFILQHDTLAACLAVVPDRLTLVNDGIAALWGATPAGPAAVIQHGTAYTHAYRSGYGEEQLFDHLDAGRMFDIREALPALVARMIDGRAASTPLKARMLRHYGVQDEADYAEAWFRRRIPYDRLCEGPAVAFSAWRDGDAAATRLMTQAADDYVCTACAMAARVHHAQCHIAFGGGVLERMPDAFIERLRERITLAFPAARVTRAGLPAAAGAALMAAFRHGMATAPLYARLSTGAAEMKG